MDKAVCLLEADHDRTTSLSNIILQAMLYMPAYLRSTSSLKDWPAHTRALCVISRGSLLKFIF